MLAFLRNQLRRSMRSRRVSATTLSRKTEKFRVNPFAKVFLCATSLLAAIVVLPSAIFASVDPTTVYARAWAVQIGRASCREREYISVDDVELIRHNKGS